MANRDTLSGNSSSARERSAVAFVLPLIVCLVMGMLAPSFESVRESDLDENATQQDRAELERYVAERNEVNASKYTWLIVAQVVVGFGLVAYFFPAYREQFPVGFTAWGPLVGVIGVVIWVLACKAGLELAALKALGLDGWMPQRVAFNPWSIEAQELRYLFLGFRFLLLAALIPLVEELFLRGWLIRFLDNDRWWTVALGRLSFRACAAATLYGVVTHPGEVIAAILWFSLVTVMMKRTGKFWDCVVAHAVTNLLLGVWVILSGDWFLW